MDGSSLRDLLDRSAVTDQLGRAARLLDGKRWSELASVFAEDVVFDYGDGSGLQHGLPRLRTTFARHLDRCGATQHLLGSIIVTVDGDRATSEAYVQARHAGLGDLASDVFDTNGEYVDTWARREGRWLIVERRVGWLTLSGNPAVLGL
ncbi:MAG: nuclear transport factor 2 family protein [Actinobacteria bacterium]|nr:nuclear transport factor 2 family protein [Actinomycetota bacterium]